MLQIPTVTGQCEMLRFTAHASEILSYYIIIEYLLSLYLTYLTTSSQFKRVPLYVTIVHLSTRNNVCFSNIILRDALCYKWLLRMTSTMSVVRNFIADVWRISRYDLMFYYKFCIALCCYRDNFVVNVIK